MKIEPNKLPSPELPEEENERAEGIDGARALAMLSMVLLHFYANMNMPEEESSWLDIFVWFLEGKTAATFIIIAGMGISLMARSSSLGQPLLLRKKILVRSFLLIVLGFLLWTLWEAEILHYYGVYFFLALLVLPFADRKLFLLSLFLPLLYPPLWFIFDFEEGWNPDHTEYLDFWSFNGFFRNLFFNGHHPLFPWFAYVTFGMWLGRRDLTDPLFLKRLLAAALSTIVLVGAATALFYRLFALVPPSGGEYWPLILFSSHDAPPMPFMIFSSGAWAVATIATLLLLVRCFPGVVVWKELAILGRGSLSLYLFHIIVGLHLLEYWGELVRPVTAFHPFLWALSFSCLFMALLLFWRRYFSRAPVELIMEKVIGMWASTRPTEGSERDVRPDSPER